MVLQRGRREWVGVPQPHCAQIRPTTLALPACRPGSDGAKQYVPGLDVPFGTATTLQVGRGLEGCGLPLCVLLSSQAPALATSCYYYPADRWPPLPHLPPA